MTPEPPKIDYASPATSSMAQSPDAPAYKRYSPRQLIMRLLLGMLIVAVAYLISAWPIIRFFARGGGK
jgi:hypothetical protein